MCTSVMFLHQRKPRKLDANARGIFHNNNRHNWVNLVSYFSFESSSCGLILLRVKMNNHLQNHKQLFKSNLKEELVNWEQNIQFHIHANFSTLRWRHVQKKVNLKVLCQRYFKWGTRSGFKMFLPDFNLVLEELLQLTLTVSKYLFLL